MDRRRVTSVVFLIVLGLAAIGAGVYQIWQQRTGPEAKATVRSCERARRSVTCRGSWTTGSLLAGGSVKLGIIEGAGSDDVGKTVDVRLHGERAYMPALRLPIIFFVLGVLFIAGAIFTKPRPRPRP